MTVVAEVEVEIEVEVEVEVVIAGVAAVTYLFYPLLFSSLVFTLITYRHHYCSQILIID